MFSGFHTRAAKLLGRVTVTRLRKLAASEHFEAGSMLPKVQACIDFVSRTHGYAVIGNLLRPDRVFGLSGATVVIPG